MTAVGQLRGGSFASACIVAAALTALGCGTGNALVGGSCAAGYDLCGLQCVDLQTDPLHCGACDSECSSGMACTLGECATTIADASVGNTGDGGSSEDVSVESPDAPEDASAYSESSAGNADATTADGSVNDSPEEITGAGGQDGFAPDASLGDSNGDAPANTVDGASVDATTTDSSTGEASVGATTGDTSVEDVTSLDSEACLPPFNGPLQCGDCTTVCGDAAPVCAPLDGTFVCVASCDEWTACNGSCVDTTTDPLNCGACGAACESLLCADSQCVGSTPGGVVLIGHDYATTQPGTAQARVLSNAVFLAQNSPLHVLSYERYADPTAAAHVDAILNAAAAQSGRVFATTHTSADSDVTDTLTIENYGVLLVPDQVNALGEVDLGALGESWEPTLTAFTGAGGIVVVLDGGTGAAQMPAFVTGAGLLSVTGQAPLAAGTSLTVFAPTDAVSLGVVSPYAAGANSVVLSTEANEADVIYVVVPSSDGGAATPVVIHKVL
ncbi:MAG: hypothetical protein ABSF69_00810 [Polyangiaceae bacterium]